MNNFKKLFVRLITVSAMLLPAATMTLASCEGQAGELCDSACDCTICNDRDEDLCLADARAEANRAAAYDCVEEYDTYVECVLDSADCDVDEDIGQITYEIDSDCLTEDFADYQECLVDATDHNDNPF